MNKKRLGEMSGIVYSTNPDFVYETNEPEETDTLPPLQQKLRLHIERAGRKGKTVTLITGFIGTTKDLSSLSQWLKTKLSTGGSVKDGTIIIQGDVRERVTALLIEAGYHNTK